MTGVFDPLHGCQGLGEGSLGLADVAGLRLCACNSSECMGTIIGKYQKLGLRPESRIS